MTAAPHDVPALAARTALTLPYTHVDDIFVDGAWIPARGTGRNPVTDPATGEVWGSVPDGTLDDVDAAVAAARTAFDAARGRGWSRPSGPPICCASPRKSRSAPRNCR
ncbi:aldehyde dehydrogenase family protein [Arthrobacter sp. Hor0625]|uniref:aldehyde dehydrogenase family protein n=1 Tax=Arthrobacter sp. Hor0625 TaxID=3457358 RepID=UPI00403ECBF0